MSTGLILRLPIIGKVPHDHLFDDELSWEVPEASETSESSGSTEADPQCVQQQHVNQAFHYVPESVVPANHYVRPVPIVQYVKKAPPTVGTDTTNF